MGSYDGAEAIERAWRDGLKPDPLLTVSEWADRYRVLSQRASSEPGRWRTERTPYLREIMDCLSPASPVQRVALMKGAQIGGTECGNCWIGYVIHQAPGPMMAVAPTVELAKRNSKQRIDPLIEESEVLRERVKEQGLFLTAGVDVQKDRLEAEVVAWGRDKESWSVDYRVIEGDTARPEVWQQLDALLAKDFGHASGHTLPIRVMCVDAGYATQDVYAWVRQHPQASWGPAGAAARQPRTVVAVKGRDRDTALLLSVSKADAGGRRRGLRVWSVGTPVAKGELYRWLKLEWPTDEAQDAGATFPPGACHFPQYGEEYFRQLTAERLVTRIVKGFPRGSWEKEPGRRNEALDCRVYARAAAAIFGLDRFEERHWGRMEEALAQTVERDDEQPASARPSVRPPARHVIQSGYMAR